MGRGQWWHNAVVGAGLPGESGPGGSLIELLDGRRVLIEGHRGLICYGINVVTVRLKDGEVQIHGADLHIEVMSRAQLVISGRIDAIKMCGRC